MIDEINQIVSNLRIHDFLYKWIHQKLPDGVGSLDGCQQIVPTPHIGRHELLKNEMFVQKY